MKMNKTTLFKTAHRMARLSTVGTYAERLSLALKEGYTSFKMVNYKGYSANRRTNFWGKQSDMVITEPVKSVTIETVEELNFDFAV